jgi:hypothetical protein
MNKTYERKAMIDTQNKRPKKRELFQMQPHEIQAVLSNIITPIEDQLNRAAGAAVTVELLMRLIAERHIPLQKKITELLSNHRTDRRNYWDCDLSILDKAIEELFHDKLSEAERDAVLKFRDKRNKLVHADFVSLMSLLNITATGQLITGNNQRNIVINEDVEESILSIERNQGFETFKREALQVRFILEKLMLSLSGDNK